MAKADKTTGNLSEQKHSHPQDLWPKVRATPDDPASQTIDWDGRGFLESEDEEVCRLRDHLCISSLTAEVEEKLGAPVIAIPQVSYGANHFGIQLKLKDKRDLLARLSHADLNRPGCSPLNVETINNQDRFEIDTYRILSEPGLDASFNSLLQYHRAPGRRPSSVTCPGNPGISGRRLFVFQKAHGKSYDYGCWRALGDSQKKHLLRESARLSAELFKHTLSKEYVDSWLWKRIFSAFPLPPKVKIIPSRDFCVTLLEQMVKVTIGPNGCTEERHTRKFTNLYRDILYLIPLIVPHPADKVEENSLFRFVLDHGDFGMHNMLFTMDKDDMPCITRIFDWEDATIVPALLTEPKMVTTVDLTIGKCGRPAVSRWGDGDTQKKMNEYRESSVTHYTSLYEKVPELNKVIGRGLHARFLWFMMRDLPGKPKNDAVQHLQNLEKWVEELNGELDSGRGGVVLTESLPRPLERCCCKKECVCTPCRLDV